MLGWICPILFVLFCISAIAFQHTLVEKLFVAFVFLGLLVLVVRSGRNEVTTRWEP